MPRMIGSGLSRREREVLELLYQRGQASAADVLQGLTDPPSYSAIRSTLRILEQKGHVQHEEVGKQYLYAPTQPRQTAARLALRNVLQTFFGGSLEAAVRTFLSEADIALSQDELDSLAALIEEARGEEGGPS
jgi:BlaI family penicillinase repressor